jgi:hypothetical protein
MNSQTTTYNRLRLIPFNHFEIIIHKCLHLQRYTTCEVQTARSPVAARYTAWVNCRSLAGIMGSIPVGGMYTRLLWVFSGRDICNRLIRRPEESHRVCVCVCHGV